MNDFVKSGEFIAGLRKERGMTQQELASLVGIGDKTISKWERGINVPDVIMLKKIADIFDVDISEILNGERNAKISPKIVKMYENKIIRYATFCCIGLFFVILFALLTYFCNNFDKFKVYRFKGSGDNYELTGNIYQVSNKYKMVVDDFYVYDTSKYDKLKIDSYKLSIYLGNEVVYTISECKTMENEERRLEYFSYGEIVEKINTSDLVIQRPQPNNRGKGHIELLIVSEEKNYTEKFEFNNMIQERNNAFFYDNKKEVNQVINK